MPANHTATYAALLANARETALLASVESLLGWDERTQLPPAGNEYRAEQMTHLAGMVHRLRTDPRLGEWLVELSDSPPAADPASESGATIRELRRQYEKKLRLPQALVEELTRTSVLAQHAWVDARAKDDFLSFQPLLEKMFVLKRQEAAALSDTDCLYDALLDEYEPHALTADVSRTLEALRAELVPLVGEIRESGRQPRREILTRRFPVDAQRELGMHAAARVGFDFQRGRLDVTHHPFCTCMGPHDHRITTRYEEEFFPCAFFGILHEAGHGMYDQGLRVDQFGLPLGDALSLGIHESQSRMWENLVGRSRPFWEHFYGEVQRAFPAALGDVGLDDFYFAINDVRPTLIRVESDEATYNLHILIRFELEQALIRDDLRVAELPAAWNEKYQQYLGIQPPGDADGVLQDIHWSAGLVGYFPTYSLGNLYAAQFFDQADRDLGGLHAQFSQGEFQPLLAWLQQQIHVHGRRFPATELIQRVTGKPLSHGPLITQLRSKLGPLYGLK
ncbi:MAG: carboxypeptidase M32 [Pirellulales bacterium]